MGHLSEERLVFYYYGDADDREAIEKHLAACDSCRRYYQGLDRMLAAVKEAPVPERGEEYGQQVWERLSTRLPQRSGWSWAGLFGGRAGLKAAAFQPRRWILAAAMAALVVAAFLVGRFGSRGPLESAQPIPQAVRERILLLTVGEHLERSQMVLLELVNAGEQPTVDISAEQRIAADLVDANRLYRQSAARSGDTAIVSVLEELERILLEIVHSPSELSAAELERIRQRIEAQGIIFKVRVVSFRARESVAPGVSPTQAAPRERL